MLPLKRCCTNTPTNTHFANETWLGWSESTQNVSSTEGYVFVPTDPFRTEEKAQHTRFNKQQPNKQTGPKIQLRNDENILSFHLFQWESSSWKISTSKQSSWEAHTHTSKHKCVPFLLARSSFRGLSKNMASEEDAFKRQEKQSSLRAPDLLQTCCWLGPGRGPPEGPHRGRHNPQDPAWYYAERPCLRGTVYSASPPISISLLSILQINSACRNNCVQHHDRLRKACYFYFLYKELL